MKTLNDQLRYHLGQKLAAQTTQVDLVVPDSVLLRWAWDVRARFITAMLSEIKVEPWLYGTEATGPDDDFYATDIWNTASADNKLNACVAYLRNEGFSVEQNEDQNYIVKII